MNRLMVALLLVGCAAEVEVPPDVPGSREGSRARTPLPDGTRRSWCDGTRAAYRVYWELDSRVVEYRDRALCSFDADQWPRVIDASRMGILHGRCEPIDTYGAQQVDDCMWWQLMHCSWNTPDGERVNRAASITWGYWPEVGYQVILRAPANPAGVSACVWTGAVDL